MQSHFLIERSTSRIDGSDIVVVAQVGGNSKTKDVVTLWTFPAHMLGQKMTPIEYVNAMKGGAIDSVCPDSCEHKGTKKCYIQHNIRAAASATAALAKGTVEMPFPKVLEIASLLGIRKVRSMGAGDSCALQSDAWMRIELAVFCHRANGNDMDIIGYTAGWRNTPWLMNTHMASVTTHAEAQEAKRLGWRYFLSEAPSAESSVPEGAVLCPSSKEYARLQNKSTPCSTCGLCNGLKSKAKSVYIPRHGNGDAARKAKLGRLGHILVNSNGKTVGLYA